MSQTVEFKVEEVLNDPMARDLNIVMWEGREFTSFTGDFPVTDADLPGDALSLSVGGGLPVHAGFSASGTEWTVNPPNNPNLSNNSTSSGSATYTVTDLLGGTDTATVSITVLGGSRPTVLNGSNDADTVDYLLDSRGNNDERASTLNANDGDDFLFGYGLSDTLNGGGGADFLDGGSGDDVLNGGAGDDTIVLGGGSRDTVIIEDRADGFDTIQGFDNSGGVHDVLDLDALFDDLENDLGVTLNAAAREDRVVLNDNGPGTDIGIDQSVAGDGSDVVQIAVVENVSTGAWDIGNGAGDDIFTGA